MRNKYKSGKITLSQSQGDRLKIMSKSNYRMIQNEQHCEMNIFQLEHHSYGKRLHFIKSGANFQLTIYPNIKLVDQTVNIVQFQHQK